VEGHLVCNEAQRREDRGGAHRGGVAPILDSPGGMCPHFNERDQRRFHSKGTDVPQRKKGVGRER